MTATATVDELNILVPTPQLLPDRRPMTLDIRALHTLQNLGLPLKGSPLAQRDKRLRAVGMMKSNILT